MIRMSVTDGSGAVLQATAGLSRSARRPEPMLIGAAYRSWFQACWRRTTFASPSGRNERTLPFRRRASPWERRASLAMIEQPRPQQGMGRRLWVSIVLLFRSSGRVDPGSFSAALSTKKGRPGLAGHFRLAGRCQVFNTGSISSWGFGRAGFEREPFQRFDDNLCPTIF